MKTDVIINRDALAALKELPSESVHCCVTSPPYYALRDYGLDAQIGQEDTPEQYIDRLTAVFGELYRVLRKDGTLWLNIADTYCGTGNKGGYPDPKNPKGRTGQRIARNSRVTGCKQKDLIGIPWLLAFSLREQGWYLRSDIIWQKQNPMPESCKDRPTRCYEHTLTGLGTALTAAWNGAPALYHGATIKPEKANPDLRAANGRVSLGFSQGDNAVSYTHLTLPTILRV